MSTIFVLAVVAFTWVGQLPEIAALAPAPASLCWVLIQSHTAALGSAWLLPLLAAQASW